MELTDREVEMIKGMIEVQQNHAMRSAMMFARNKNIMAKRQEGWDLERVALLERILEERNE